VDTHIGAVLRQSGASWTAICRETGLSKGAVSLPGLAQKGVAKNPPFKPARAGSFETLHASRGSALFRGVWTTAQSSLYLEAGEYGDYFGTRDPAFLQERATNRTLAQAPAASGVCSKDFSRLRLSRANLNLPILAMFSAVPTALNQFCIR